MLKVGIKNVSWKSFYEGELKELFVIFTFLFSGITWKSCGFEFYASLKLAEIWFQILQMIAFMDNDKHANRGLYDQWQSYYYHAYAASERSKYAVVPFFELMMIIFIFIYIDSLYKIFRDEKLPITIARSYKNPE